MVCNRAPHRSQEIGGIAACSIRNQPRNGRPGIDLPLRKVRERKSFRGDYLWCRRSLSNAAACQTTVKSGTDTAAALSLTAPLLSSGVAAAAPGSLPSSKLK